MNTSNAYDFLAEAYQSLMEVDYGQWAVYLQKILQPFSFSAKTLLDGGCGTGVFSRSFAAAGWQVLGVDRSAAMLNIAWQLPRPNNLQYVQQDLIDLKLDRCFNAVLCVCDVINYITEQVALQRVFQRVYNHLGAGGVFLFDVSTLYKLKNILGNNTFAESQSDYPYIWENSWDETTQTVSMDITLFKPQQNDLFLRRQEFHIQKGWKKETLKTFLVGAGFKDVQFYKAFTFDQPDMTTERLQCVAIKR